jgi:hypothetical protein
MLKVITFHKSFEDFSKIKMSRTRQVLLFII